MATQYTEESLVLPILALLSQTKYMTTSMIIPALEEELELTYKDKKIVRGKTRRFDRTVHNAVSHRTFHYHNNKAIVETTRKASGINIFTLTKYGRKYLRKTYGHMILSYVGA